MRLRPSWIVLVVAWGGAIARLGAPLGSPFAGLDDGSPEGFPSGPWLWSDGLRTIAPGDAVGWGCAEASAHWAPMRTGVLAWCAPSWGSAWRIFRIDHEPQPNEPLPPPRDGVVRTMPLGLRPMPTSEGVVLPRNGTLELIGPDLSSRVARLPSGLCDTTTEPGGGVVAACLDRRGALQVTRLGPGLEPRTGRRFDPPPGHWREVVVSAFSTPGALVVTLLDAQGCLLNDAATLHLGGSSLEPRAPGAIARLSSRFGRGWLAVLALAALASCLAACWARRVAKRARPSGPSADELRDAAARRARADRRAALVAWLASAAPLAAILTGPWG